jgi:hypothetical protein
MSREWWVMAWTIAAWTSGTVTSAYVYVTSRVELPDAAGYETDWSWQLFFFSLVRLPVLILVLGALRYVEHRLWSREGHPIKPPDRRLEWCGTDARVAIAPSRGGRSAARR